MNQASIEKALLFAVKCFKNFFFIIQKKKRMVLVNKIRAYVDDMWKQFSKTLLASLKLILFSRC